MSTHDDTRRADQIETDIERTRAEVSSTIDAIQSKLTPGQLMDQALQYVRGSGPGEFGANLADSVRQNPLPVALIGLGVAWLMIGPQRGRARPAWRDDVDAADRRTPYRSASITGHDAWADGAPSGDDADDTDGEGAVRRAASAAADVGHRVKDTVTGAASRARERLAGMAEGARSRTDDLMHGSGRERVAHLRERSMQMFDEQPLVLGAVGIAIGAALGAALPSTRREDALMGEVRDELLEGAKETAREQMQGVKASARRVAETAREEVEHAIDAPQGAGIAAGDGPRPAATH